ncbi:hypothetical protein HY218_01225 [Candidatus Saccharibacteria bacterium]|nr:hypothetical protein [Candidatus Saccharibacteria bacterium]
MSNVKSQVKWVVKHFSSLVLVLFVAAAGVAYFTNRISINNFSSITFIVVTAVLVLVYYSLINLRAGLVFVLIAAVLMVGVKLSDHPAIKTGQYQAVFLINGQGYFGHLTNIDTPNAVLKDVYYLQSQQPSSTDKSTTTTTPQLSLIRLGSELHGPESQMNIKTDQILYWENLQDSSKVVQAIKKNAGK